MSVVAFPTNWIDEDTERSAKPACEGANADWWFDEAYFDRGVRLCRTCPVKQRCLSEALARGEPLGVWGGLKPAERAALPIAPVIRLRAFRR